MAFRIRPGTPAGQPNPWTPLTTHFSFRTSTTVTYISVDSASPSGSHAAIVTVHAVCGQSGNRAAVNLASRGQSAEWLEALNQALLNGITLRRAY